MRRVNLIITIVCVVIAVPGWLGVAMWLFVLGSPRVPTVYWVVGVAFLAYACVGWALHCVANLQGDGETRCRKCRYILRGITEPRCPECGTPI